MNQPQLLQLFDEVCLKSRDVIEKKNKDYANEDALSNFKMSAKISGISTEAGCLNQIAIKVSRLGVLLKKEEGYCGVPMNEPIEDSIGDLFNYAFLLLAIRADKTGGGVLASAKAAISANVILNNMISAMPWEITEKAYPYILEAMEIYKNQK